MSCVWITIYRYCVGRPIGASIGGRGSFALHRFNSKLFGTFSTKTADPRNLVFKMNLFFEDFLFFCYRCGTSSFVVPFCCYAPLSFCNLFYCNCPLCIYIRPSRDSNAVAFSLLHSHRTLIMEPIVFFWTLIHTQTPKIRR